MQIELFDIKSGVYRFLYENVNSTSHSHPVYEFLFAVDGTFDIITNNGHFKNLKTIGIEKNIIHSIISNNCVLSILMIESLSDNTQLFSDDFQITFQDGLSFDIEPEKALERMGTMESYFKNKSQIEIEEQRINSCIAIISTNPKYSELYELLCSETGLSRSRVSKLFKFETGITVQSYYQWNKLKYGVANYLNTNMNFTQSSLESDFYDQAHFIKVFKKFMGTNPYKSYNS